MYENLLASLKTKSDLERFEEELHNLKNAIYQNKDLDKNDLINQEVGRTQAEILLDLIQNNTNQTLDEHIDNILKELDKKDVLEVTIAFEPRMKTINRIYEWVSQNTSKDIIIDINTDQSIVGGAVVSYKGKYGDFTLKKTLSSQLSQESQEFLNILNKNG